MTALEHILIPQISVLGVIWAGAVIHNGIMRPSCIRKLNDASIQNIVFCPILLRNFIILINTSASEHKSLLMTGWYFCPGNSRWKMVSPNPINMRMSSQYLHKTTHKFTCKLWFVQLYSLFSCIECDQELVLTARNLLHIFIQRMALCVGGDNLLFMNTLNYFAYPHH